MKKLIKQNIVDFSELVLNNYYKLGLDETDAVIIIKLHYLLQKKITFISTSKLSNMLSISPSTTSRRLQSLIERGYVKIKLKKNGSGKETEAFDLDYVITQIIKANFDEQQTIDALETKTIEAELAKLFEEEFNKPLSVLDVQVITKWLNEDKYSEDDIKDALFQAVKSRKLSIKYVDGILLKNG